MKKLHLTFVVLFGAMTVAATAIALVLFVKTANDPYTRFPAWASFCVIGIYYAIGVALLGVAWLFVWLLRRKACKNNKKAL